MATIKAGGTAYASLDELLKRLYAPWEIEAQVNTTHPVLATAAREGAASLGGSGFYFPVRVELSGGHAYIAEDADLPAGGASTVRQAVVSPTVHVGVVELTGLASAVSSGDAMAFARAFDENVQSVLEEMTAYKEGCLFRNGQGVIATTVTTDPGGLTVVDVDDVGFCRPGQLVDFRDVSAAPDATLSTTRITKVDWPQKKLTVAAALSATGDVGDYFTLAGTYGASEDLSTKEPIGFETSLTDTSNPYLGINPATYGVWLPNLITANAFLDESILLKARTLLTQVSGVTLSGLAGRAQVITHPQQVDVLFKLAIPRIRYSGNESFDLGNSENVKFGGIEFLTSYQAPVDKAYLGDFRYSQALYTPNGKLHIDTEYNGAALKWLARKDAGLVFLKEYCAFAVRRRNAFVRISALSTPARV